MNKQLTVTVNGTTEQVVLNGIEDSEQLTPKMAVRAARVACGHRSGVTVTDERDGISYRLYANSARKKQFDPADFVESFPEMIPTGEELFDLFCGGVCSVREIAAMDQDTNHRQIHELRESESDSIGMSHYEVSWRVLEYAKSQ